MEVKKKDKVNLERYKGIFLQIGFVITLAIVFGAFEITSSPEEVSDLGSMEDVVVEEEQIPITEQPEQKAPPPPPTPQLAEELVIAEDDVELDEEMEVEDMEAEEETEIVMVETEEEVEEEQVFMIVENMPEFPGGMKALYKFLSNNIKYPALARENNIQGKVYLRFVVTAKGEVDKITVARGVDPLLDKEAVRVAKMLPKWKPGMQRGKSVSVWYTLPVLFQLQN